MQDAGLATDRRVPDTTRRMNHSNAGLSALKNIGPVTAGWLAAIGVRTPIARGSAPSMCIASCTGTAIT